MMKRIAIVNIFGIIPGESGYSRSHYICKYLVESGYQVDLIVGTFNHWKKAFKDKDLYKNVDVQYNVVVLENSAYSKNISFARYKSQFVFAKNLTSYFKGKDGYYDIIINVLPPSEVGLKCIQYCRRNNIPYVIDLNDLWPEAFSMVIKNKVLWYILTAPIRLASNKVYSEADGIIGTSETYTKRPLQVNYRRPKMSTVFVGTDIEDFDNGIKEYSSEVVKPENEFWVTYAGSLGTSYDIHTMMKAGGILRERGYYDIKMIVLGDGPSRQDFEVTGKECGCNSMYSGFLPYRKMAAYLSKSDLLLNSFVKKAPQSIVNKIGDYLSAAKPMINTCSDPEFRSMVDNLHFGENVEAENPIALADLIERLYKDKKLCQEYSTTARNIAETKFDRKVAYQDIVRMVNDFIGK